MRHELNRKIAENSDPKEIEEARIYYNEERYKSTCAAATILSIWNEEFKKHQLSIGSLESSKEVNMALAVMDPYMKKMLDFTQAQDPRVIREMLNQFKSEETTNSTTKIKYLNSFEKFIRFILKDIDRRSRVPL